MCDAWSENLQRCESHGGLKWGKKRDGRVWQMIVRDLPVSESDADIIQNKMPRFWHNLRAAFSQRGMKVYKTRAVAMIPAQDDDSATLQLAAIPQIRLM